jgi:RNA polymerase sigma factor (TIGR02999 family)
MTTGPEDLARMLPGVCSGDRIALDAVSELLYKELRRIAASHLRRESHAHTLQPTALVNEVYVRMAEWSGGFDQKSRAHFLALAATMMRQVLVHHARKRNASKRGGGLRPVTLDLGMAVSRDGSPEVIALDDALQDLTKSHERKARVIELRYFGGLSDAEIAEALGISVTTVGREIRMGLALLYRAMSGNADAHPA